jgi:hypothetical protein
MLDARSMSPFAPVFNKIISPRSPQGVPTTKPSPAFLTERSFLNQYLNAALRTVHVVSGLQYVTDARL